MIGTEQHTQRTMPLAFDLSEHGFHYTDGGQKRCVPRSSI